MSEWNIYSLVAVVTGFAALTAQASAHDFWIQPEAYQTDARAPVSFTFYVGHGDDRERWSGRMERVVKMVTIAPGNEVVDRRLSLHFNDADDGEITFATHGAHVIAFQSTHSTSILPPTKFNSYLSEVGLTPAIEIRAQAQATTREGREIYSRRAKAVICVGDAYGRDSTRVPNPVGLTLELVPERDTCALREGEPLPVTVFYEGRPLPGALVKLTSLDLGLGTLEQHVSDRNGRTIFNFPRRGSWLLNVVWTRPLKDSLEADFDTVFSSLTFGFAARTTD